MDCRGYKYGNCSCLFKNGYWPISNQFRRLPRLDRKTLLMTLTQLMAMDVVVLASTNVLGGNSLAHLLKDDGFVIYETSG